MSRHSWRDSPALQEAELERDFNIYIRERFASYAEFRQACDNKDNRFAVEWLEALSPAKRQVALRKVAEVFNTGACLLLRMTPGENCDIATDGMGTYIVVKHLADDMLTCERAKDGRVKFEVLASYEP